tara:strand:+ start:396 stop:677 length:282 start_codon:yes stop_codon:yes gene_type:complete
LPDVLFDEGIAIATDSVDVSSITPEAALGGPSSPVAVTNVYTYETSLGVSVVAAVPLLVVVGALLGAGTPSRYELTGYPEEPDTSVDTAPTRG